MKKLCVSVVVLAWALTACGSPTETAASPTPQPTMSTADSAAPFGPARDTPAVLRFTATTLDGAAFDGAGLTGKPVVFWFWAPWCPKCQTEGPAVAKIAERYREQVNVVGVAGLDRSTEQMTEFVRRTGTSKLPQLNDTTGDLYKHFRVTAQSSYLFVDTAGKMESATGPLDEKELSALVDRHLL